MSLGGIVGAVGSIIGAGKQKKAAKKASKIAQNTANENNALTREIYGQNAQRLDPYAAGGIVAGNALQGLLGLPTGTVGTGGGALGNGSGFGNPLGFGGSSNPSAQWNAYLSANPDVQAEWAKVANTGQFSTPAEYAQWHYQHYGQAEGRTLPTVGPRQVNQPPATGTPSTPATNPALSAFDQFRQSTNYTWRLGQGQKALEMSRLPGGGYDSGATRKALVEYGQNFASNELATYMDRLAQQQQIGLAGASALAGVSQNMVNNITANNNSAASAAANSALLRANATSNMWSGIASGLGSSIGALGSSYGG